MLSLSNVKHNFFRKLPINIVKSEKHSDVLPPSRTFLFIITLLYIRL